MMSDEHIDDNIYNQYDAQYEDQSETTIIEASIMINMYDDQKITIIITSMITRSDDQTGDQSDDQYDAQFDSDDHLDDQYDNQ
ncbi:hypothetical protein DPMN_177724 [Dreissena polymorpha]|uniref:Uncharacterized protein n=1 Tax=Dreissena polymorpha TaxID=45954 RepID=A0A9D4IKT2_DREPO|nr:hypothetical protein DPMN_177724 [Dreissena polymorpha]